MSIRSGCPHQALYAGQSWAAGSMTIRVLDLLRDGRVWFSTDHHPPQAMTAMDFQSWLCSVGAEPGGSGSQAA